MPLKQRAQSLKQTLPRIPEQPQNPEYFTVMQSLKTMFYFIFFLRLVNELVTIYFEKINQKKISFKAIKYLTHRINQISSTNRPHTNVFINNNL